MSVPYRLRGYLYFTCTEQGKQYPIHCRRIDASGSLDELLLDLNHQAEGHSFLGLGAFDVSNDNRLLAYALDSTGFRQYTLRIKNLWSGEIFRKRWNASPARRGRQTTARSSIPLRTRQRNGLIVSIGTWSVRQNQIALIYEETDERFRIEIERTRSGAFLLLVIASHTASEVRFLPATQPMASFA